MTRFLQCLSTIFIALCLSACATALSGSRGGDYLPGGTQFYSYGVSQSKENFANIERAQSDYTLFADQRTWGDDKPAKPFANIIGLQSYFPLHVRWQLKDGRQFIAENIDIRAIMREYFKKHDIKMQWQKEGRSMDGKGDYDPALVHEVKDDTVIIKWLITTNHTLVEERFTAAGAATRWKFSDEEFIVTTIKGTPTSGIDFENKWEFNRTKKAKE